MKKVNLHYLNKKTIVCVAPTSSWFSLWRNRQQVMWRLAKHYRVVFVEPQREEGISFFSNLRKKLPAFLQVKISQLDAPGREIWLLQPPPAIPYTLAMTKNGCRPAEVRAIVRMNCALLSISVLRALQRLGTQISILWLYEPFHQPLIGRMDAQMTVFYVYDEVADFITKRKVAGVIREYDEMLTRQADVVFATSCPKYEKRLPLNVNTYLVPNGADFDLFHQAIKSYSLPLASEIAQIPRPIAGYAGWLGYQIDVELLLYASRQLPNWSFALVGPDNLPANQATKELRRQKNVYFLGRQPIEKLPLFLKAFDIGLIPYLLKGHALSVYPLKLNEYLSAGLPVVATTLPAISEFQNVVTLAASREAFVTAIAEAAQLQDESQIAARVSVARQNTWDRRVEDIQNVLAQRWEELH